MTKVEMVRLRNVNAVCTKMVRDGRVGEDRQPQEQRKWEVKECAKQPSRSAGTAIMEVMAQIFKALGMMLILQMQFDFPFSQVLGDLYG